ncbi:MAG: hypothetical protein AAFY88_25750 [Acidobacteriota bacterium]
MRVPILVLVILFSAAVPSPVAAQAPGSGETPTAPAKDADLASKMWWNQSKKVAELGLSDAQRTVMDAAVRRFLEDRAQAIRDQKGAFSAYGDALASGDQAAIEARGAALSAAMATPLEGQVAMMAEVTGVLEAPQRQLLVERYPKLLSRLWIRSGRGVDLGRAR